MVVSTPQKKGGINKNSTPPLCFEEKPCSWHNRSRSPPPESTPRYCMIRSGTTPENTPGPSPSPDSDNNQVLRVRSSYGGLTDIILDNDLLLTADPEYQDFLTGEYTLEEGYDFNLVEYDAKQQRLTVCYS